MGVIEIDLGGFVRFVDPGEGAAKLAGFVSHIQPAWKEVALFSPVLIARRKSGREALAFVYLAQGMHACFDVDRARWSPEDGLWLVRWVDVLAFTKDEKLIIQRADLI